MEACYARCNCWTDFPDMGGQITHEVNLYCTCRELFDNVKVDALCLMDTCFCSYDQDGCPYGTLKTNAWCCTKTGITCDDTFCDTEGNCACAWMPL